MKNTILALCLAGGALSGISLSGDVFGAHSDTPVASTSAAGAIRFVDLNRVIDQAEAFKAEKETMRARWQRWIDEVSGLEEELKSIDARIKNYPGERRQSAFAALVGDARALQSRTKAMGEWYAAQRESEEVEALIKWTEAVEKACSEYAAAEGISAIFNKWSDTGEELNIKKRYNTIMRRPAIFLDPSLDVTDAIIAALAAK